MVAHNQVAQDSDHVGPTEMHIDMSMGTQIGILEKPSAIFGQALTKLIFDSKSSPDPLRNNCPKKREAKVAPMILFSIVL